MTLLKSDINLPDRKKTVPEDTKRYPQAWNMATNQGPLSEEGCYCGDNLVIGNILKDTIIVFHGPVGCAYNTWHTKPYPSDAENFQAKYALSTDMKESNVIFGGEKRLKETMLEAFKAFPNLKHMMVYTTCTTALIGDDIKAVAKEAQKELNDEVEIFCLERPGFCGSQPSSKGML